MRLSARVHDCVAFTLTSALVLFSTRFRQYARNSIFVCAKFYERLCDCFAGFYDGGGRHPGEAPAGRGRAQDGSGDLGNTRSFSSHVRSDVQAAGHDRVGVRARARPASQSEASVAMATVTTHSNVLFKQCRPLRL